MSEYSIEVQYGPDTAQIVETPGQTASEWDRCVPGVVEIVEPAQIPLMIVVEVPGLPGPPGSGGGGDPSIYDQRADVVSDAVVYRGEAAPGSDESQPVWRVRKVNITYEPQLATQVQWANGSDGFNHTWADRLTYNYQD